MALVLPHFDSLDVTKGCSDRLGGGQGRGGEGTAAPGRHGSFLSVLAKITCSLGPSRAEVLAWISLPLCGSPSHVQDISHRQVTQTGTGQCDLYSP